MSSRIRVVTFKLRADELAELDRYAEKRGLSRSEVIREAINKLIKNNNDSINDAIDINLTSRRVIKDQNRSNGDFLKRKELFLEL